jgi:hypothetical protein
VITYTRSKVTGNLILSAFVTGQGAGEWLEQQTFVGYSVREAKALFRRSLESQGLRLA